MLILFREIQRGFFWERETKPGLYLGLTDLDVMRFSKKKKKKKKEKIQYKFTHCLMEIPYQLSNLRGEYLFIHVQ